MAGTLKVGTITTPSGSGTITIPSGVGLSGHMYPAFDAHLSSDQSMSDAVTTKIQCDTEVYDTNNCYDTSTYRFTPNVAGKYFVYGACNGYGGTLTNVASQAIYLYKNGSVFRLLSFGFSANYVEASSPIITAVVDMNGTTDYLELFVNINVVTGSPVAIGSTQRTFFGAYRLGA